MIAAAIFFAFAAQLATRAVADAGNSTAAPIDTVADGLSFDAALAAAEHGAPLLNAESAKVAAAQAAAIPAAALPDPKLAFGIENVPIAGDDRGSLNNDSMTMQKIGVMQDFPAADKRRARADIAAAATGRAMAERVVARQKVRAATAQAWLRRFYLEQQVTVFTQLVHENDLLRTAVNAQLAGAGGSVADALLPQQEALALADRRDALQQEIDSAKAGLKQWLGDDAYLPLRGAAPEFAIDNADLSRHVHKHPELAAFEPMLAQAEAELREAQAQKKSDWSVGLDYQRRQLYPDMVSLQFTYTLPVSTETRQTPNIVAKQQLLAQLDDERANMLREHIAQLEIDNAAYRALAQQIKRIDSAGLQLARQKIDLLMAGYRAGQNPLADVIKARRELLEINIRRLELLSQQAQLAAKLHFAYEDNAS